MSNCSMQQAAASTRDIKDTPPSSEQNCSDVIHISVFFDGTGNNKDADEDLKRLSNPALIWRSAEMRKKRGLPYYPIYISGVGTSFNGKPLFAGDQHLIDIEDKDAVGGAFGAGGGRRINHGQQQVNDALRSALLSRAEQLGGQVQRHANAAKKQSFEDVNLHLKKHRLIKQINVSIFGFSRGAALARAFSNQWLWKCEDNRGKLFYEGHPIRFVFLGLFDTVASFGLPAANLANDWKYGGFKGRDLVVDDRIERCVHYVAAHELRFSFPVDLIRKDGKLNSKWLEKTYPGAHSDVGGGYEPLNQDISNNYARIPMRDMMEEALNKGVRLLSLEEIEKTNEPLFQERFECKPATEAAYQAYVAACNPRGSIEDCVQAHMATLYSAFGTLKRQGGESVTQREHRKGQSWAGGRGDMSSEIEKYERAKQNFENPNLIQAVNPGYMITQGAYTMWIKPQDWQLKAWYSTAPRGVMDFIHTYVHDSKVGFMSNAEPFSYFSQRGINESNRSVYGWIEHNVNRPVDQAVETATDYASEKVEQAKKVASETADKVQSAAKETAEKVSQTVDDAVEYASEKAEQAKKVASEAADKVQSAAKQAADKVSQTVDEAADYASKKAAQAQRAVTQAAEKAQATAKQAAETVQSTAKQAAEKARQTAASASKAVGEATQNAMNQLEEAWNNLSWW